MSARRSLLFVLALFVSFSLSAQVRWVDGSAFPRYGQICDNTYHTYSRLPSDLELLCRPAVWWIGKHSTGIYIRFRSNSSSISARWTTSSGGTMEHMSASGQSGLDLYVFSDGGWRFLSCGLPDGKSSEKTLIAGMTSVDREYMMYFPLYDELLSLQIGVDEGASLENPCLSSPRSDGAIVIYGTSITQGGCVSRPGMLYTSILSRELDREVVNLGFGGNGVIDLEIASLMVSYPTPAMYVLDWLGNADADAINSRGEAFYRILREAHPDVPVLFGGVRYHASYGFDVATSQKVDANLAAQKALFSRLRSTGEKNIYLVGDYSVGDSNPDQTVDGTHFTDLGSFNYARFVLPVWKKALSRFGK